MSLVDLQALANRSRIYVTPAGKYALVEALLPHVEAGTVSLEEWVPFTLPNKELPQAESDDEDEFQWR